MINQNGSWCSREHGGKMEARDSNGGPGYTDYIWNVREVEPIMVPDRNTGTVLG
jgi:hypothetical protein